MSAAGMVRDDQDSHLSKPSLSVVRVCKMTSQLKRVLTRSSATFFASPCHLLYPV